MTERSKDIIAWIDVETDGLGEVVDNDNSLIKQEPNLLSVACILTDTDMNELTTGIELPVYYSESQVEEMKANAHPFVLEMHEKTGLWNELTTGLDIFQVDKDLCNTIAVFAPEKKTARIGGNSVRLDLNVMEVSLPKTYGHLHYRMVDVTTLATLARWWGNVPSFPKKKTHNALSDIKESIGEARYYKERMSFH